MEQCADAELEQDGGRKDKGEKHNSESEPDSADNRSHLTVDAINLSEAENQQIHLGLAAKRSQTMKGKSKKKKGKKKKKEQHFEPLPEG